MNSVCFLRCGRPRLDDHERCVQVPWCRALWPSSVVVRLNVCVGRLVRDDDDEKRRERENVEMDEHAV